jgi:hypothetical protein
MQCIHWHKYRRRLCKLGNNERTCRSQEAPLANWTATFLLARDFEFFEDADDRRLAGELLQLRKILNC